VHSAPAYGVEDFESCRRYGMKDEEILTPVMGRWPVRRFAAALRRYDGSGANPKIVQELRKRNVCSIMRRTRTATCTAGGTDAGDPARDHAMVAAMDKKVGGETLRATALRGIEQTESFRPGARRAARHYRQSPGLDAVAAGSGACRCRFS